MSLTVLLVEDDAASREFVLGTLRGGVRVDAVRTLVEAGECCAEVRYDLLLVDVGLPDGQGDAWLAQLSYQRGDWTYKWQWQKDDSQTRHAEKARLNNLGIDYQWQNYLTAYLLLSTLKFETEQDHAAALGLKFLF